MVRPFVEQHLGRYDFALETRVQAHAIRKVVMRGSAQQPQDWRGTVILGDGNRRPYGRKTHPSQPSLDSGAVARARWELSKQNR